MSKFFNNENIHVLKRIINFSIVQYFTSFTQDPFMEDIQGKDPFMEDIQGKKKLIFLESIHFK